MLDLWYKNAVIYSVDVDDFQDSNGDGIGDLRGLIDRLDYIAGLGVTCIWLLPIHPSPNRDDGYDVADYYGIDPRLGDPGDFVEFTHQARERGLRVLMDLVINHTSDQHPWFKAARSDRDGKYRDYYVWSQSKPDAVEHGIVFPGHQESTWTYDRKAGAWYFHRFYRHQPDLNIANREVREQIEKIMGFWLELGVSGFRVDAAPFVIEGRVGTPAETEPPQYEYLREIRNFLSWRRGDAVLLAEANVAPDRFGEYFGTGDRLHMLFDFYVNQHLFLALARKEAAPLARALEARPSPPDIGQWTNFLRNHDELDLGRLSDAEREEAFAAFAPEKDMRIYRRGIRRRLAPMLGNDRERLRMAYSLVFSLPGTPVLRYGEEIGMGDDLALPERAAVRTPMQWSDADNAGFSTAPAKALIRPVISDGPFGHGTVNVSAQQRDDRSLLNWIERLIRMRRNCPEIGWGEFRLLASASPAVLLHRCEWRGRAVAAAHNLAPDEASVTLERDHPDERLAEIFGDGCYDPVEPDGGTVRLGGYGYRWFRITRE